MHHNKRSLVAMEIKKETDVAFFSDFSWLLWQSTYTPQVTSVSEAPPSDYSVKWDVCCGPEMSSQIYVIFLICGQGRSQAVKCTFIRNIMFMDIYILHFIIITEV